MTLIYELNLKILTIYRHIENERSRLRLSKVRALKTADATEKRYHAAFADEQSKYVK